MANLGDVDGDGLALGTDAHAISRLVVGLDSDFPAFSGMDTLIADMNGDGVVSSLDAALIFSSKI